MAERLIRTLKLMFYKYFHINGTFKWIDIVQQIIDKYNSNYHRTIKQSPMSVTKADEERLLNTVYNLHRSPDKAKYKVNQYVRISKKRNPFSKFYEGSFGGEVFKITKVDTTFPVTYFLEDMDKQEIKGRFYEPELTSVADPDAFLVHKILRTTNDRALVSRIGYPDDDKIWVNKSDVIDLGNKKKVNK